MSFDPDARRDSPAAVVLIIVAAALIALMWWVNSGGAGLAPGPEPSAGASSAQSPGEHSNAQAPRN